MTREELLELRERLFDRTADLKRLGDFSPDAPNVRLALESNLALTQHLLDRMKR